MPIASPGAVTIWCWPLAMSPGSRRSRPGFDRREAVTIPPLPHIEQCERFEAARKAMVSNFAQRHPTARYLEALAARWPAIRPANGEGSVCNRIAAPPHRCHGYDDEEVPVLVIEVAGMTCAHCVSAIERAVRALPSVDAVSVDLARGEVHVEGTSDAAAVCAAIGEEGYEILATRPS